MQATPDHRQCSSCPYIFTIKKEVRDTIPLKLNAYGLNTLLQMTSRTHLKRKEVDDVMGGEAAWENVDKVPSAYLCLPC